MNEITTEKVMTAQATIGMPEIEKAVRRYMKEIMKNTTAEPPIDELILIYLKSEQREYEIKGLISYFKAELSVKECKQFIQLLKSQIEKELASSHTFLITGRLLQALRSIREPFETESYTIKAEICYEILCNCSDEYELSDVYKLFEKMDRL